MDSIGADIRRELARFGPALGLAEIVAAWPAAVGPAIARNAWPARVSRDGTLHVATSSSSWAFELAQLEPTLRARLGERLEECVPAALRFATGPLPEPGREEVKTSKQIAPPPSAVVRAQAERMAREIEDPALREAVARAAAASLTAADERPSDRSV
jgi:hypothetical protein